MAKILIIDDEEMVRMTLSQVLSKLGHEVTCAEGGRAALALCRKHGFDLVISDIVMPDMEGIETMLELASIAPETPVIAMSGGGRVGNFDFLELAQEVGARAALKKPFRAHDVKAVVDAALSEAGDPERPMMLRA